MVHFIASMAYRPTERTERRKQAARARLAQAAHDQVAEAGYASADVKTVAARAGVATGTVYRHFESKSALFAEVFRDAAQRELDVVAAVAAWPDRTVAERIAAGAEAFARRALTAPVLAYALLVEPVDPAVEAERLRLRRGHHLTCTPACSMRACAPVNSSRWTRPWWAPPSWGRSPRRWSAHSPQASTEIRDARTRRSWQASSSSR